MLTLSPKTVVYILCPTGGVTGGPEALHQLCDKINLHGGKAQMVYVNYTTEEYDGVVKTPFRYRHYRLSVAARPVDEEHNVMIVPEIWPNLLAGFGKIQKCIWWLSVNYASERFDTAFSDKEIIHLYQSTYADNFLRKQNVKYSYPLFDYLSLQASARGKKESIVIYNPKKGYEVTEKIMQRFEKSAVRFVALKGFTRSELLKLMKKSGVYIDFGDHPGKDRIPREAAIHHNVIITSQNGSAAFFEDLPIPAQFKIDESKIDDIERAIRYALDANGTMTHEFDYYRRVIATQEHEFTIQTRRLFCYKQADHTVSWYIFGMPACRKIYFDTLERTINKLRKILPPSIKAKLRSLG